MKFQLKQMTERRLLDVAAHHSITEDELINELLDMYTKELYRRKVLNRIREASIAELSLPEHIYKLLTGNGILKIKELQAIELLGIKGIGPKTIEIINKALLEHHKLNVDAASKYI